MLHIQFSVQALEIVWFYSHGQGCFDKIIAMHSTQGQMYHWLVYQNDGIYWYVTHLIYIKRSSS